MTTEQVIDAADALDQHRRDVLRQRRRRARAATLAAAATFATLIVSVVVSVIALHGVNTARENTQQDQQARYRLCVRDQVERAELHLSAEDVGGRDLLNRRKRRLPLMDCSGNLNGGPAVRLSADEQRRWRLYFDAHERAPTVRHGRVLLAPDPADGLGPDPPP